MTLSEAGRTASPGTIPGAPRLGTAVRAALRDFLDHSWRLVAVNLAWSVALMALLAATTATPLAWLLSPLLALPTAGVYRVAAVVVRDGDVSIRDGFTAWVRIGGRALVVGASLLLAATVLATNLVGGLEQRDVVGWSMATFAGWGLVATGVLATIVWPLLVDPLRAGMPLRDVLRLTALLALAFPLRFGALLAALMAVVALSTLAVVVVLTMAIGISASVSCRYVLPAADRYVARVDGPP